MGTTPHRGDGRDLVKEWEAGHPRGKVVHTRDQLLDLDTESTDQVEPGASWPHGRQLWPALVEGNISTLNVYTSASRC